MATVVIAQASSSNSFLDISGLRDARELKRRDDFFSIEAESDLGTAVLRFEAADRFNYSSQESLDQSRIAALTLEIEGEVVWSITKLDLTVADYSELFGDDVEQAVARLFADDDNYFGSNGSDTIVTLAGRDRVLAGAGNDTVKGGLGDDRLEGGLGHDDLHGNQGQDVLRGGRGNDEIMGGVGADTLTGGLQDDVFVTHKGASPAATDVIIDAQKKIAAIEFGDGVDIITDFNMLEENDRIVSSTAIPLSRKGLDNPIIRGSQGVRLMSQSWRHVLNRQLSRSSFNPPLSSLPKALEEGDPLFIRGSWESSARGVVNAGSFEINTSNKMGSDYLFIVAPEPDTGGSRTGDILDLIGTQVFVLLDPFLT
jgi:hypothetical protein